MPPGRLLLRVEVLKLEAVNMQSRWWKAALRSTGPLPTSKNKKTLSSNEILHNTY
jgi:hypothetical protein